MTQNLVVRSFTCRVCGLVWTTAQHGNFRSCASCRESARVQKQTKVCSYGSCGRVFLDGSPKNTRRYCSSDCTYRDKTMRVKGPPVGGFLSDRVVLCPQCRVSFAPVRGNQVYCTVACQEAAYAAKRDARRNKVCPHCHEPFRDDSIKGNARAHEACSRAAWGVKTDAGRPLSRDPRLMERRRGHGWAGGGRLDDIRTLKKFTATWWGRVAELVYAAYKPSAEDVVATHGGKSPFDFLDAEHGRVDVKGTASMDSPYGLRTWKYELSGTHVSCDTLFLVGFSVAKDRVEKLWLMPSGEAISVLTPKSKEYHGRMYDVTEIWGVSVANRVLQECLDLDDPKPLNPDDRFAWMDDLTYLNETAPGHLGRRAEILYRSRYPTSMDVNRIEGPSAPYDFLDADGNRVNVKSCRGSDRGTRRRWSFTIRSATSAVLVHLADIYSCLCLDTLGTTIVHEFRIPASAVGDRWLVHVYEDYKGTMWESYRVST